MRFFKKALSLVLVLSMVASFFAMSGFQASAAYWGGTLKFSSKTSGKFRILVVSDIQDDESVDARTLALMTKAIETQRPDVIVFNGDNTKNNCNDFGSGDDNVKASINTFLAPLRNAQIPFLVTFGNHDSEGTLDASRTDLYGYFQNYGGGLMINHDNYNASTYGGQADIDGVGSGYANIRNSANSADAFRLYVMDSGDYDGDGYDGVKTSQLRYYNAVQAASNLPHMWFQHIVVPDIYTSGLLVGTTSQTDGSVQGRGDYSGYYYKLNTSRVSPNNAAYPAGDDCALREQPCPAYNSTYTNSGHTFNSKTLYSWWQTYQSTFKGGFFGHDHMNSYYGIDANNIPLGNCKAATYSSYNDGNAGCRVIEITESNMAVSTWTVTSQTLAIEQGESSTDDDIEGCLNVPPTVYVGHINADQADASNSFRANQWQGNYIQGYVMNNTTKNLMATDLEIEFTDTGASGVSLQASTPNGNVSTTPTSTANGVYKWKIDTAGNESTAIYGNVISYHLTYTKNGQACETYAYSFVDRISIAPGYYIWCRTFRNGKNNEYVSNAYVVTLSAVKNSVNRIVGRSRARIAGSEAYEHGGTGDQGGFDIKYGFYDYNKQENAGFVDASGYPDIYALNWFSPSRSDGANSGVHYTRNATAGQSPVADVYLDESRERSLEDINMTLNYYCISDQDGHNLYARPVGIKGGDASYSQWGVCANYAYDRNQLPTAANGGETSYNGITTALNGATQSTGNMCALVGNAPHNHLEVHVRSSTMPSDGTSVTFIPSCFAYHDEGVNGNNDWPAGIFTYGPIYAIFHVIDKGDLRSLVNQSRTMDYFNTYGDHLGITAFSVAFRNAYLQLQDPTATQAEVDTATERLQEAIAAFAHVADDISPANESDTPSSSAADADSAYFNVPDVIYVAGSYTLAAQTAGSTIVTSFPQFFGRSGAVISTQRHGTVNSVNANGVFATNRNFTFTVPTVDCKNGTQMQVRVFCSSGSTNGLTLATTAGGTVANGAGQCSITNTVSASTRTISGTLSGTATASTAIYFIFSYYNAAGQIRYVTDGLAVEPAPLVSGWYTFTYNDFDASSNNKYKVGVCLTQWICSVGIPIKGTAYVASTEGTGRSSGNDVDNNKYRMDFSSTSQDFEAKTADATNGKFLSHDVDRGKVGDGTNYFVCGSASTNSTDGGARAVQTAYVDPYYSYNRSDMDIFWNSTNWIAPDDTFRSSSAPTLKSAKIIDGNPTGWAYTRNQGPNYSVTGSLARSSRMYGDDDAHGSNINDPFGYRFTGSAAISGSSTYLFAPTMESNKGGKYVEVLFPFKLVYEAVADRSALRTEMNRLISLNRQLSDGYVNDTQFFEYLCKVAQTQARVKSVLYNRTANDIANIRTEIINAEAALHYAPADYTVLYDALDTVLYDAGTAGNGGVIDRSGTYEGKTQGLLYLKANDNESTIYYKGAAAIPYDGPTSPTSAWRNPENGAYKPEMYLAGANELINAIAGRGEAVYADGSSLTGTLTKLDSRFQSTVNAYAQTLLDEWHSIRLADANYSPIDTYTSMYSAGAAYSDETSSTRISYTNSENQTITTSFPESYFYQSAHADCTGVTYYYNDWETSLSTVNHNYKRPHDGVIVTKGAELEARYNNLRLRIAKEYYLNESYSNGTTTYPAYANNLAKALSDSATAYNGGNNNSTLAAIDPSGASAAIQVPRYTGTTWGTFTNAYANANTEKSKGQTSWKRMSEYELVKELGDNLVAARTALVLGPAEKSFLTAQIGIKATYEIGGTALKTRGGAYYYTTTTWNAYAAAVAAAVAANAATYTSAQQETINTLAANVYTTRNALVAKKLSEYPGTWEGVTGFDAIHTKVGEYSTEMVRKVVAYTLNDTALDITTPIFLYSDSIRSTSTGFNGPYSAYVNAVGYDAQAGTTQAASRNLADYDTAYEAALTNMKAKYDARTSNYNAASYGALDSLIGVDWKPLYTKSPYTKGGAYYYNNWSAYNTALTAANGEGRTKNASQQAAINTLVQNLYTAYRNLVPKKLSEYAGTWETVTGLNNIITKAGTYNTTINSKTVVYTINEDRTLNTTTQQFIYEDGVRNADTGFTKYYVDFQGIVANAANKDLAPNDLNLIAALNGMTAQYNAKVLRGGFYAALNALEGSAWVPTYANTTNYPRGGARYYTSATWSPYASALAAGNATTEGRTKTALQQASINTLVQNLYSTYGALVPKKLSEYPDTWEGATNFNDIHTKVGQYNTEIFSKVPAYTLNDTALVTTTEIFLYNDALRATTNNGFGQYYNAYVAAVGPAANGNATSAASRILADYDVAYTAALAGMKAKHEERTSNYNAASYGALASLVGADWKPLYTKSPYTKGGAYYYSSATWTPYANALSAATTENNSHSKNASQQGAINTLVQNLHSAYVALVPKKLSEYAGTWESVTGLNNIITKAGTYNNTVNSKTTVYTINANRTLNTTTQEFIYEDGVRNASTGFTKYYGDFQTIVANAAAKDLAPYDANLITALNGMTAQYNAKVLRGGFYAALNALEGSSWVPTYANTTNYPSGGARYYTSATWNPYVSALAAGNATTEGRAKTAEEQDEINTLVEALFTAYSELAAKKLSDYPDAWESVSGLANIITKANTYNSTINSKTTVYTINANRTLNTTTQEFIYEDAVRDADTGFTKYYGDFQTIVANAATKDLALYDANLITALNGMKTKFDAKVLRGGFYAALDALEGSAWIPTYASRPNGGAYYYSSATWSPYASALAAGNATTEGRAKTAEEQDEINTLVEELFTDYSELAAKKLSEYPDAWESSTGYAAINAKALAYYNTINSKVPVYTISGTALNTSTTDYLYSATSRSSSEGNLSYNYYYSAFASYYATNKDNDLGAHDTNYKNYLAALKTAYDGKTYAPAYYAALNTLETSAWIPAYAVGGTARKTEGGAYYYNNWTPYNTYVTAGVAGTEGRNKNASQQGTVNTLVQNIYNSYNNLVIKPLDEYADAFVGADGNTYTGYEQIMDYVDGSLGWTGTKVTVTNSFNTATNAAITSQQNLYKATVINSANALQSAVQDYYYDEIDNPTDFTDLADFKTALNSYKAFLSNNIGQTSSYNAVFQNGWSWIINQVSNNRNTTLYPTALTETTLVAYYARFLTNNLDTARTSGVSSISDIIDAKATLVSGGATAADQAAMNAHMKSLYDELRQTTAVSKQLNLAKANANTKANTSVQVYDPIQLNSRAKVTNYNYYTTASRAALQTVISAIPTYNLFNATPAALGFYDATNPNLAVLEGTEATKVFKAAGLTPDLYNAPQYSEDVSVNTDYKLVMSAPFLDGINDAISYAKSIIYNDGTGENSTLKQTVANSPTGATHSYATYTAASTDDVLTMLNAATNLDAYSVAQQDSLAIMTKNIIDEVDDSTQIFNATGGLTGTLNNAGSGANVASASNGLVLANAYYNYVSAEKTTPFDAKGLVWNGSGVLLKDANDTYLGQYYFQGTSDPATGWYAYIAAFDAATAAGTSAKSNQQATVDALASAIYVARNNLRYKVLGASTYFASAEAAANAATAMIAQTVGYNRYDVTSATATTTTPNTIIPYTDDYIALVNNKVNTLNATYLAYKTTYSDSMNISNEAALQAATVTFQNDIAAKQYLELNSSSVFYNAFNDLLTKFIGGTYNTTSGLFNSTVLSTEMATEIDSELDAINAIFKAGKNVSDIYSGTQTYLGKAVDLMDELYAYVTGTRATDAKFAVTLRTNLENFLDLTVPVVVYNSQLGTSGTKVYDGTTPVFNEVSFVRPAKSQLNSFFNNASNWPYIYQLDDNLFSATEGSATGATYSGTAYTHPVSQIAAIYNKVGIKADYYKNALNSYVNSRFETHMSEIYNGNNKGKSLYFLDAAGNAYILASIGTGTTNAVTGTPFVSTDMPWANPTFYTAGCGYKFTNALATTLVKASDAPATNRGNVYYPLSTSTQNPIPWFTEGTATTARTVAYVNDLLFSSGTTVNYGTYAKGSKMTVNAATIINNIIANGWSAAYQTQLLANMTAVQKDLDTLVGKIYYNLFNLTERNAIEPYQEVTALYLAAIGKSTVFTNTAARNNFNNFGAITSVQKQYGTANSLGGRVFNLGLLDEATYGIEYVESPAGSGIYYSSELPGAYANTTPLDTLNTTIFNSKLKMDQSDAVNGDGAGSYKSQMISAIQALAIKAAEYSDIFDLITQFKNDNLAGNETYESYNNTAVVTVHGLGQTIGSNAANYRLNEGTPAGYTNNNGFYERQYYTETSWNAVNTYLTSNYLVTDAVSYNAGLNLTGKYNTASNLAQIDSFYSGLKAMIDQLELKPAGTTLLTTNIDSGSQAVIDSDYYDVEDPTWANFLVKLEAAQALSSGVSVIRQQLVDTAAAELAEAYQALKAIVETIKPVLNILDSIASVKSLVTGDAGLGITADQVSTGTFTYPNVSNYSMVIYTNEINPMIALNVKDVETAIGTTGVTRASKPERMSIFRTDGTASAITRVITTRDQVVDLPNGVTATHDRWVATVAGSLPFTIKTASASNGSYAESTGATAVLQPQFDPNISTSQFVVYTINATDSAQNIKTHSTAYNYAKQLVFDSIGDTEFVNSTVTTDENQLITICIKYNNVMPLNEDSNGDAIIDAATGKTTVLNDEGYYDGARVGADVPVIWSGAERTGDFNTYLQKYTLYREDFGIARAWEFVSPIDTEAYTAGGTNIPVPNDPILAQSNLGSFWYVLKAGASDFDDAVIEEYYTGQGTMTKTQRQTAAKEKAQELLNQGTYLTEFKENCMNTVRFGNYGAYTSWSQSPQTTTDGGATRYVTNGDLVYVHTYDRWGNLVNRFVEVTGVDTIQPVLTTPARGQVNVVEDGGSGVAKVDLFNYAYGTSGSSLYLDFRYSKTHLKGTSSVSVDGSTWSYSNNQFEIGNLTPNGRYTIAVTDYSNRVGSVDVFADADGVIIVTVNNAYTGPIINSDLQLEFTDGEQGALGTENTIVLNGEQTIILNSNAQSAIELVGPTGNVFADQSAKLIFNVPANTTEIKLTNLSDNTEETLLPADVKVTTVDELTKTWEITKTFVEGTTEFSALAKFGDEWDTYARDFSVTGTTKAVSVSIQAIGLGSVKYTINGKYIGKVSFNVLSVPYGADVKFVANPTISPLAPGAEFIYWMNETTDRIIGSDTVRTFTAVNNLSYSATFTINSSIKEGKHLVTYVNSAGNVVDTFEVKAGDDYTEPAGPTLTDYNFVGWNVSKAEAINSEDNVLVEPIYTIAVTNTVTLTQGDYSTTGAGTYQSEQSKRALATISTSATAGNGDSFLYWYDEGTQAIASYNRVYSFYVLKNITLTPVYGDPSTVTAKPVARITLVKYDAGSGKLNFYSERSVPTGFTLIESGIIVTKTVATASSLDDFIIGGSGVGRGISSSAASNGYYSIAIANTATAQCFARAYISYSDAQGNIYTDYSPVAAYPQS